MIVGLLFNFVTPTPAESSRDVLVQGFVEAIEKP
jgi:hypothetical protein